MYQIKVSHAISQESCETASGQHRTTATPALISTMQPTRSFKNKKETCAQAAIFAFDQNRML